MYYQEIIEEEHAKSCHGLLLKTASKVPTLLIHGNHDYNLQIPGLNIVDNFLQDGIYDTHGWQFDKEQRLGSPFYFWIVQYFPWVHQRFFTTPSQVINSPDIYTEQVLLIDKAAERFVERKKYQYLCFGHTHFPEINGKLLNCGDFINSCSYIVIEDGKPELKNLKH